MEESVRMEVFLSYFCERIFILFFMNMSQRQRSKGLYMPHGTFSKGVLNNSGSTKHIKIINWAGLGACPV